MAHIIGLIQKDYGSSRLYCEQGTLDKAAEVARATGTNVGIYDDPSGELLIIITPGPTPSHGVLFLTLT